MENTDRRTFLAAACGVLVAGFAGLEAVSPAAAAGVKKLSNGKVQLTIAKIPALAKNGGVLAINVNGAPVAVVRTTKTKFAAFDLRCPHQGATVDTERSPWVCPVHQSQFDTKTGARISGPTPTGLAKVKTVLKAGVVTVG